MSGAYVFIDHSQFPGSVQRDLLESLRTRQINPKFHYESYKQAAKWLALHEAYSPARTDASCARIYDEAFAATVLASSTTRVHVIGLGCGGGQKEARLLQQLQNRELSYSPCDLSIPLVLTAREAALPFLGKNPCSAIACDLGAIRDLETAMHGSGVARIITLLGVIPNFEPAPLFAQISHLLRANDLLLCSANLAPRDDYAAGVQMVLPQYDNELTRDWLMTLLFDLGFEHDDGEMDFAIETDARGLHRITVNFELKHPRDIRVFGETVCFRAEERLRLFFSYRHTPGTLRTVMTEHGIRILNQWVNDSKEEGVFLCRKVT